MNNLYYLETESLNPYHNLALEEYLLDTLPADSVLLYLWQNEKTVVIGKNQSASNEVNIVSLEQDKGHLVRRLSGGGAVFHDTGNLNFTFVVREKNFDVIKQTKVILHALKLLGIDAEINGRNDLTIQGCKFSGHAYYHTNKNSYHHGTIMVNVNPDDLSKYLNVSKVKLASHHVKSVKSRTINLMDIKPDLAIPLLKEKLREAFEDVYEGTSETIHEEALNASEIKIREKKFSDPSWIYDKQDHYDDFLEKKFSWGTVTIQYCLKENQLSKLCIFTDALQTDLLEDLPRKLRQKEINESLYSYADTTEEKDVIDLLLRKE